MEASDDISRVLAAIHTGDWSRATAAVSAVTNGLIPVDALELGEYRRRLNDTLITARAARANLAADLSRVLAAQRFSSAYQNGTAVPERSTALRSGGHKV